MKTVKDLKELLETIEDDSIELLANITNEGAELFHLISFESIEVAEYESGREFLMFTPHQPFKPLDN
jgi:hypothetical protein